MLKENQVLKENTMVQPGGHWSPLNDSKTPCTPVDKVLVLFPFRDRELHLLIIMDRLHKMLRKQFIEYDMVVVEQVNGYC